MARPNHAPIVYVPVGRAIERAEPGDHLMVVMGVCVGIYTGDQPPTDGPVVANEAAPKRSKTKPATKPSHRAQYAGLSLGAASKPPSPSYAACVAVAQRVMAVDPTKPYTTGMLSDIAEREGVDPGEKTWRMREAVGYLRGAGKVRPAGTSALHGYVWVEGATPMTWKEDGSE